jgi:hypothetical protein
MTGGLQPLCLGAKPLETHDQYFFQVNTCGYCPYVTSSLTRGWVCRLQLLLALASTVILRSESCGTHDHILPSQIRDSPILEGVSPRSRAVQLHSQALGCLFVASYDSQGYCESILTTQSQSHIATDGQSISKS